MPTTYSPSLRIELIGEGEQTGIWGGTTNNNLGTILETAITGHTNVLATSTNQVLSVSDGAPDQARNAILVLTTSGAVTTAFNVFAPPVNKTYVVVNNSAYQATIYCSNTQGSTTPAGTGIIAKAGKTTQMWTDGTNMYPMGGSSLPEITGVVYANGATDPTVATGAQMVAAIGSSVVTNATNAATSLQLASTNWTIKEVAGKLYFAYGGVNKVSIDSSGNISTLANVTGAATSV
jgi:hypothetical protein